MTHSGPIFDAPPQQTRRTQTIQAAKSGFRYGSALAIVISWSVNKSIIWAIIHGFLSWLYVAYYALTR